VYSTGTRDVVDYIVIVLDCIGASHDYVACIAHD